MATILAYTSPAVGHLFPFSALLSELSGRGHTIHLRTLTTGVEMGRRLGFSTDTIDPRIEAIVHDDSTCSAVALPTRSRTSPMRSHEPGLTR